MKYWLCLIVIFMVYPAKAAETQICVRLKPHHIYQARVDRQLSALGILWRNDNHQLYYIDPNSALYDRVFCGDIFVSADGMTPEAFRYTRAYLNDVNTPVQVVFRRGFQQLRFTTYRRSVELFGPQWHQTDRN